MNGKMAVIGAVVTRMYLIAQKWKSSIVLSTMRLVKTEDDIRIFFHRLKNPNQKWLTTTAGAAMIHDTSYWFAWKVSPDEEPVLLKDLLKEIR